VWQKTPIQHPLLKSFRLPAKEAISIFKKVQLFMGDKDSSKGEVENNSSIGIFIIQKAVTSQETRDEFYCQVCKQVTSNPTVKSLYNGWHLLTMFTQYFPPSKELIPHLIKFFKEYMEYPYDDKIQKYAKFCHRAATHIEGGAKGLIPTVEQVARMRTAPLVSPVFGGTLSDIMKIQAVPENTVNEIPLVLVSLIEDVEKLGGLKTEGIFRIPGSSLNVLDLRLQIENGTYGCTTFDDPHVPGSLLKYWLREIDEPVIPPTFYDRALECAEDENSNIQKALDLVAELPELNRKVLYYIIRFLKKACEPQFVEETKMGIENLSMVFAPCLLRCPSENPAIIMKNQKDQQTFVKMLIESYDKLPK